MSLPSICIKDVVTTNGEMTILEAARLMKNGHIGDLVVVKQNGTKKPIGILTDRDIVKFVVADNQMPEKVLVEDIMSRTLVTVPQTISLFEALDIMQENGIHRVPVVNSEGSLIGIVASADILSILASELVSLSEISQQQISKEKRGAITLS